MRPKCLQDIPDRLKVTGFNGRLVIVPVLNENRQHDRTFLLDGCPTYLSDGTTNSLNDLNLTATGVNESHTVKRWNVYTLS